MQQKSSSTRMFTRHAASAALLLSCGIAGAFAQPGQLNMKVSGSTAASTVNLQPGTPASEYQLTGNGDLGRFTLRVISAGGAPQPSATCSGPTKLYVPVVAGGAVARFENGDLLTGRLTQGSDCIDFAAGHAVCIRVFQVSGGTGRFNNTSSAMITLTMTVTPVIGDSSGNPVFFSVTGAVTGAIPGLHD